MVDGATSSKGGRVGLSRRPEPEPSHRRHRAVVVGRLLVVLVLGLFVARCGATPPAFQGPVVLDGTSWRAVMVAGRQPLPGSEPTVSFEAGGKVGGRDGCNHFGGQLRPVGNGFRTDELGGTLMLCDDPVMAIAQPFLAILGDVERVGMVDGRLILAGPAGEMVLVPAAVP
jgi:heat shock protein HslJ